MNQAKITVQINHGKPDVLFQFAAISLVFLLVMGCDKASPVAQPIAPKVTVGKPLNVEMIEWDSFTGRLDAVETVEIRSRVSGYLQSVHFSQGAVVKKGDLLFVIDPRPFVAELERAEGERARAQARHELATIRLQRSRELLATASISQDAYDERAAEERQSDADLRAARAAVETARLNVEFTEVRSPITGRISRLFVTEGNLINGGTAQATLLTTVVSLDPIYCYFDSDERTYLKYSRLGREGKRPNRPDAGIPLYLGLADEEGFPHRGHIDFIDNRIDPNTGTMRIRGIFPNSDLALTPGLFARVKVPGSEMIRALLVPEEAIGSDQTRKFVYVIAEENAVDRRFVQVGPRQEEFRVIREGLAADERIVINGIQRIRPGVRVNPEEEQIRVKNTDWVPKEYETLLREQGTKHSLYSGG
ncbi:MAG: efflux RND transporter periplasmic adaptor subunit [Desulfomonile tiedjei]|uniref:Efflux RND transporter periplasmic adaptor subunit n=1 Tax=Desulfomonile tiedjei TaxID=2358 RepID=A0A9D6Z2M0_9BACT|nr:efflux RND transporter periplasmic adaptor subunit [Desulfomonile tiedjei]